MTMTNQPSTGPTTVRYNPARSETPRAPPSVRHQPDELLASLSQDGFAGRLLSDLPSGVVRLGLLLGLHTERDRIVSRRLEIVERLHPHSESVGGDERRRLVADVWRKRKKKKTSERSVVRSEEREAWSMSTGLALTGGDPCVLLQGGRAVVDRT